MTTRALSGFLADQVIAESLLAHEGIRQAFTIEVEEADMERLH